MKKRDGRLVGILGTVIFHLIAAIIFMSFQISAVKKSNTELFQVELQPVEETAPEQEKLKQEIIKSPDKTADEIVKENAEMLNIARNLSNKTNQKIDPREYEDMVKEELIKSGKLGRDNFIDEQKKIAENGGPDDIPAVEKKPENKQKNQPTPSQQMAANYKGPTRIYYDLAGRNHTYLPIPIYKCMGSGKVVLEIEVNQEGRVEKAEVIAGESTATDPCLIETAVSTALISRFNYNDKAPKMQKGTLSYQFVAQ
jgi:hypothetical protein